MRELYHDYGCKHVEIRSTDKKDCGQCQGSGYLNRDFRDTCGQCNGHGWLWDNGGGYAFKPYTLESNYN